MTDIVKLTNSRDKFKADVVAVLEHELERAKRGDYNHVYVLAECGDEISIAYSGAPDLFHTLAALSRAAHLANIRLDAQTETIADA